MLQVTSNHALGVTCELKSPTDSADEAYLIAAIVAFGGVEPVIPTPGAKSYPDFFFSNGTLYYGVEVKRPSSDAAIARHIKKAGKQLKQLRLHSGAIVMDLSDCIEHGVLFESPDSPDSLHRFEADFEVIAERTEDLIWSEDQRKRLPGFENVGVLLSFARVIVWNTTNLRYPKWLFRV